MHAKIRKWGHSLAVRIPKAFAAEARLAEDTTVEVSVQDGKLVIASAATSYSLKDLLSRVTPKNLHGETETGGPLGRELW